MSLKCFLIHTKKELLSESIKKNNANYDPATGWPGLAITLSLAMLHKSTVKIKHRNFNFNLDNILILTLKKWFLTILCNQNGTSVVC